VFFKRKSALTQALNAWIGDEAPPSDDKKSLSSRLPSGDAGLVRTADEAKLVCAAVDRARSLLARSDHWGVTHDLHTAMALMQQLGSKEAYDTLLVHGVPRLRAMVRERLENPDSKFEHALFALKLIGMCRQPDDVQLFIDAARAPLEPGSYFWEPAFYGFNEKNSGTPALIAGLANPLPVEFIRVVFLDKCNELAIAGVLEAHPFASPEGLAALEGWLRSTSSEDESYAVSVCVALPFLPDTDRERLFELAARHSSVKVRIESAWARARLGIASGVDDLVTFARDAIYSTQAIGYLKELGLEARIPKEASEPGFVALAEMCQWLAHPNEMGRPPDEIALADTRELHWPPTGDRRRLWLFRYRYEKREDQAEAAQGCGLVGSVTWAMFGVNTIDLPPEDLYGLHCAWELVQAGHREAPREYDVSSGRAILAKYNPGFSRPILAAR
jgi:hypothetical protein